MLKISKQQFTSRWDILPDTLKESLFSEENSSILWQICQAQHLTDDKIQKIAILTGNVILGFSHPEDLALEIRNELGLNPAIAESIASEIDRKIFASIRGDLLKVFAPPTEQSEESILDLRKRTETDRNLETDRNQGFSGEIEAQKMPAGEIKMEAAAMPELVIKETDKNLEIEKPVEISRNQEIKAEIEPKIISTEVKAMETPLKPIEINRNQEIKTGEEGSLVVSEVEPMIIHQEPSFQNKPAVDAKKSSLGGFFGFLNKNKFETEIKPSPVRAEVKIPEFNGNQEIKKPVEINRNQEVAKEINRNLAETPKTVPFEPPKPIEPLKPAGPAAPRPISPVSEFAGGQARVVHYSQFSTPVKPSETKTEISVKPIEVKETPIIQTPKTETKPAVINPSASLPPIGRGSPDIGGGVRRAEPPENLPITGNVEIPNIPQPPKTPDIKLQIKPEIKPVASVVKPVEPEKPKSSSWNIFKRKETGINLETKKLRENKAVKFPEPSVDRHSESSKTVTPKTEQPMIRHFESVKPVAPIPQKQEPPVVSKVESLKPEIPEKPILDLKKSNNNFVPPLPAMPTPQKPVENKPNDNVIDLSVFK